ncbi:MAG: hypothetical protein WBD34_19725 [Burkholderiaceae bacterium]
MKSIAFGALVGTVFTALSIQPLIAAPYKSLQSFCEATGADTAANCQCGQKTADKIASPKEQQVMLTMMAGDDKARQQAMQSMRGQDMKALMTKMNQITKGCGG